MTTPEPRVMPRDVLREPWYHVGRPWSDSPGMIYAGNEDPHAGTFVADCGSWSDELFFGERPTVDPAALADLIVREHNAALVAVPSESVPRDVLRFAVETYDARRREVRNMIEEADREADTGLADPDSLADALMEIAEGWCRAALVAVPSESRLCGCKVDAELGAGAVCPACGHRDHGPGCTAIVRAVPSESDAGLDVERLVRAYAQPADPRSEATLPD